MDRKSLPPGAKTTKMAQRSSEAGVTVTDRETAIEALLSNQGQKALGTAVSMLFKIEVSRHPIPKPESPDPGLRLSVQPISKVTERRFDLIEKVLTSDKGGSSPDDRE